MEHAGPSELTFLANPKYAPKAEAHARRGRAGLANPWKGSPRRSSFPPIPISISPARWRCSISRRGRRRGFIRWPSSRRRRASAKNASIGPFAVVGENVTIGRNAVLHPHVVIYEGAQHRRRFLRPLARRGARVLPHRQSRDSAERRGHRRRRLRLRQARRRHALQNRSERRHGDRRRRGDPDAHLRRSRDGRRNAREARREDRQPGAGRATPAWSARTTSSARRPVSPDRACSEKAFCWPDRWAFPGT